MTRAEEEARRALRESMRINGDLIKGEDAEVTKNDETIARFPRVQVDLKIPLWGLATGAGVLLWGLISMYFTMQDVARQMAELQVSVRASNVTTIQLATDQTLLKFRVEKLEAERHQSK